MEVIVPFAAERPKTRLEGVLSANERASFSRAMLRDVIDAVRGADGVPTVLATADVEVDAPVVVDERPLSPAVNTALTADTAPTAVVMADLALATPAALARLFAADGDVVVAPGRGGGTNALVSRHPEFRVDYHGASFLDHLAAARDAGAGVTTVDSFRLSTDVDERADLVEVLLHADGSATDWLDDAGFSLSIDEGRVTVTRE